MMLSECSDFIVRFFKGSNMKQLTITAHDKEQAVKLAEIQCKYCGMGAGKFELISVRKEGEPDPIDEALEKVRF
jgi:hypothetical protein